MPGSGPSEEAVRRVLELHGTQPPSQVQQDASGWLDTLGNSLDAIALTMDVAELLEGAGGVVGAVAEGVGGLAEGAVGVLGALAEGLGGLG